jgi:hypothetical protein
MVIPDRLCAAGGRFMTGACSTVRERAGAKPSTSSARRFVAAPRSLGSSPPAYPRFATSCSPGEAQAKNLAQQTKLISEFIDEMCRDKSLHQTTGRALVQVHCHHEARMERHGTAK